MQAEVHVLHESDFYEIRDFRCGCVECSLSKRESCERFSICFVRSGFYEQRVFRKEQQMHIGRMLVSKPGIEYVIRHINNQPDLCTSFNFSNDFFERVKDYYSSETSWFFRNPDLHSLLLTSYPDIEFLHQRILSRVRQGVSLEIDDLVVHLVEQVMCTLGNRQPVAPLAENLKNHHLNTIEKARDYLFDHFEKNVSLQQLADHCCVSLFHFSRIFKAVMNVSPHQYLTSLRLNHARFLLSSTKTTVTQVAFQSGFNSLEHFMAAYKQRFRETPTAHRHQPVSVPHPLLAREISRLS